MSRIRGGKERPSEKKRAAVRANAKKARFLPPPPRGDLREQMLATLEGLRRMNPRLVERALMLAFDEWRNPDGSFVMRDVYHDGEVVGQERLRVSPETQARVIDSIWDRIGLPRRSEAAIELPGVAAPLLQVIVPALTKPGSADA
jgi:hypothetical protein